MAGNRVRSPLIAFAHLPKTAGQLVRLLFRRHFGLQHLDVEHRYSFNYGPNDLRCDLRLYPRARSLAGHPLKAWVDFGEFQDRLAWFTYLRDPVSRYISQYFFDIEVMKRRMDVPTWIRQADRGNMQVWYLAGTEDVEAAKKVLLGMRAVGLMEHFNESLLIIRSRLGLDGFDLSYDRPKNVGTERKGLDRTAVKKEFKAYGNEIRERNKLDIELYEFAVREIWPREVADYGPDRIEADLQTEFRVEGRHPGHWCRWWASYAYRNAVYKPFVALDRVLHRQPGPPPGPKD